MPTSQSSGQDTRIAQTLAVGAGLAAVLATGWFFEIHLPREREKQETIRKQQQEQETAAKTAKDDADAKSKAESDVRQKAEALRKEVEARLLSEQRARAELDAKLKMEADARAKAEVEVKANAAAMAGRVTATKDKPFVNSLGMMFVPVPGTDVLFSIWETRKQDYEAYSKTRVGVSTSWQNAKLWGQKISFAPDHPVVNMSWEDARAFCAWLTEKELGAGKLPAGASYRLPTDLEWSAAVGLPPEGGATPKDRDGKIKGVYPWGNQFPPPQGAGNYSDITAGAVFGAGWPFIQGYRDGFATTSSVGSFAANKHGLFDLGGNVWEWCEDLYDGKQTACVLRGASFNRDDLGSLLSSYRGLDAPDYRGDGVGFRLVLVGGSAR